MRALLAAVGYPRTGKNRFWQQSGIYFAVSANVLADFGEACRPVPTSWTGEAGTSFAHPGRTPSTADEAALLVRNDHEPHVAMAATEKIKFAWDAVSYR